MLTRNDIRRELLRQCRQAGSAKAWARAKGVAISDVSAAGAGRARPKLSVLLAMGYCRPEVYAELGAWKPEEQADTGWNAWALEGRRRGKKAPAANADSEGPK